MLIDRCPHLVPRSFQHHPQTSRFQLPIVRNNLQRNSLRFTSTMANIKPPQAQYRQLGKSGLRVSVPTLGAMSIGDKRWMDWVIEEKEVNIRYILASLAHMSRT